MTWGDFQRQYDAQGREKGDGYSPSDFDGMTEEERARAREMLLARALRGDTIDLSGLRYIGNAATVASLDAAADVIASLGWRDDIIRHEVLFELTGKETYLTNLAMYLDQRDADVQERAAGSFTWYVLSKNAENFLLDRICDGRHEAAIFPLLQAWIAVQQRAVCDIMCFQRHLDLIRQISSDPPKRRYDTLAHAARELSR